MNSTAEAGESPTPPQLCEYAAAVTSERLDRMLSHIDGVRKGDAPEPVHQMRVWSRRSRAALEIFKVCFPGREFTELEREVKAAADALGEARDLDVMIMNLRARAEKLPVSHRTGIKAFVDRLQEQREALQMAVAAAVTNLESHNLAEQFRSLTDKVAARKAAAALEAACSPKQKARRNGKRGRRNG